MVYIVAILLFFVPSLEAKKAHHRAPDNLVALNAPATFGKTHFIVGMPADEAALASASAPAPSAAAPSHSDSDTVFFGPDGNLRDRLLDFIRHEKKSLKIAVYMFTDKQIAQALIDAHNRGIAIEVLTDPTCIKDKYNKIHMLVENNIPVYVYEVGPNAGHTIMHHKFVVFGANKNAQPLVWNGSFNFTQSAHARNKETVVLLHDATAVQKFSAEFEQLKNQCVCCKNKLQLAKTMMK